MLGPVPGRVDVRAVTEPPHLVAVLERLVGIRGPGVAVDGDRDPMFEREPAVAGDMVGVRVRLQHAHDPHALLLGRHQVLLDRVGGVDQQRLARVGVTDEVGGAPEVLVDELPEQHPALTLAAGLAVFPIVTRGPAK